MVGIYKIENLINSKVYVGQSININNRWKEHKANLRNNNHQNKHLQNAWNKYGEENFNFEIIEECEENKLNEREQYWLDYYGGMDCKNNYNKKEAGSKGRPSEETLLKQSKSHLGNKPSEETRKKMGDAHKGKVFTEQERLNISNGLKAFYKDNPEAKEHIYELIEANKGKKHTEEHKQKISNALKGRENTWNKGKQLSEETKQKMSNSKKGKNHPMYGKHHTKETKQKISKSKKGQTYNKGFHHSNETKQKLSEIAKGREVSLETREKLRQKALEYWERKKDNNE